MVTPRPLLVAAVLALLLFPGPAPAQDPKPRPLEDLVKDLGSKFSKQREQAARDLGALGPTAARVVPDIKKVLGDPYEPARFAAAEALSRIDPSETAGIPLLVKGIRSAKPEFRLPAIQSLGRYPPTAPGVVDALIGALGDAGLKAAALGALSGMGNAVVDPLLKILEREDPSLAEWVLGIGRSLGTEGTGLWLALLDHPHPAVRSAAGEELSRKLRKDYPEAVQRALAILEWKGASAEEVEGATAALSKEGSAAVPGLAGVLCTHTDSAVRIRAAKALGRFGAAGAPAVPSLRRASGEFTASVREAARTALEALGSAATEVPPRFGGSLLPRLFSARADRKIAADLMPLRKSSAAVKMALAWLARHQAENGSWDAAEFRRCCKFSPCGGPGLEQFTVGVTGLALLAFLAEGEFPAGSVEDRVVRKGLEYLLSVQDPEGCFGGREAGEGWWIHNHPPAALAMMEAAGMTGSLELWGRAQNGLNFILQCQNPYLAWRYGVRPQDNDSAVTVWMVLALGVGQTLGLDNDPASFDGAKAWFDKVTDPESGRVGYTTRGNTVRYKASRGMGRFPVERTEGLTAMGLLARTMPFRKLPGNEERLNAGFELLMRCPPAWDTTAGTLDFHYWHFGALALSLNMPRDGDQWQNAAVNSLLDSQGRDSLRDDYGSWEPGDPWSFAGGRVYSTAINCLTLQTPYRYRPPWR